MRWKRDGGAGGNPVLTFADNMHRADQPFMLGDQWACAPSQASTIVGGSNLAASINVAGNAANFSICSSNGANGIICFPIPITWDVVFGRSQFSECRIVADNSGAGSFGFCGPCVLLDINKNTGYVIETNITGAGVNTVGRYVVISINGGGAPTNINGGPANAGFPFSLNDTLRIEALVNTPAVGQTTIKSYKNGVLNSSDVDAVNHYSFGVCAFDDSFVSAGITQSFDNFFMGAL